MSTILLDSGSGSQPVHFYTTLAPSGFNVNKTIRVNSQWVTADNTILFSISDSTSVTDPQRAAFRSAQFRSGGQGVGWFDIVAGDAVPTINVPILVLIIDSVGVPNI